MIFAVSHERAFCRVEEHWVLVVYKKKYVSAFVLKC